MNNNVFIKNFSIIINLQKTPFDFDVFLMFLLQHFQKRNITIYTQLQIALLNHKIRLVSLLR